MIASWRFMLFTFSSAGTFTHRFKFRRNVTEEI
jgi:hypothetical protein